MITEPITIAELARRSGQSIEDTILYFEENFGGYENYVAMCRDPRKLENKLMAMSREEHIWATERN